MAILRATTFFSLLVESYRFPPGVHVLIVQFAERLDAVPDAPR